MNIDHLVKMANEIGSFFSGTTSEAETVVSIRKHLELYWDPRMREQIHEYATTDGSGLTEAAKLAVLQVRRVTSPGS